MTELSTIGYESDTQDAVIGRLKAAGVEVLIDVRAVAASRRAGFSKTILRNSLRAEGIDYLHLRALGTPTAATKRPVLPSMKSQNSSAISRCSSADTLPTHGAEHFSM